MELRQRLQDFPTLLDGKSDEDYDKEIQSLVEYIKSSLEGLVSTEPDRWHLLDVRFSKFFLEKLFTLTILPKSQELDPSVHSAAFALVLHFHISTSAKAAGQQVPPDLLPGKYLWIKAVRFLTIFDAVQVRYVGREWRYLVESIIRAAEMSSKVRSRSVVLESSYLD